MEEKKDNFGRKEIIIATLIIIAASLGFYMLRSKGSIPQITIGANNEVKGQYSLSQIIALGIPLQCTFDKIADSAEVNGTIFISGTSTGSDVRGDFKISGSPVGNIESHFITKDFISYTWTSIANVGYKKPVVSTASATASPSDQASIVGENDKINYDCSPWLVDQSQFTLPNNVIFKDLK